MKVKKTFNAFFSKRSFLTLRTVYLRIGWADFDKLGCVLLVISSDVTIYHN